MSINYRLKFFATALLAAAIIFAPLMSYNMSSSKADTSGKRRGKIKALPEGSGYVLYAHNGGVACRDATPEEALDMQWRAPGVRLKPISPIRPNQTAGLKIMLRGTTQLENFPQAKAAFIRAAATWEAIILTPITIVLDADFGPTRFGTPFSSPQVLGATNPQIVGAADIYSDVRDQLIALSATPDEAALYNKLPTKNVPTSIGNINTVVAPTSVFRAIGFLEPVADPAGEQNDLGSPPSIGFNSAFPFDFNPDDGIDVDKVDFDAVAVHEIGHALGFTSRTGFTELDSSITPSVSLWDLFRFRPGTTSNFTTSPRILSSGGSQVFFFGSSEVPLATGKPNGSGGDGSQPSHWKDNLLVGTYIGIMDPIIDFGERNEITANDISALDSFGYDIKTPATDTVAPTVSVTAPKGGEMIAGNSQFNITFSSSDAVGVVRHDIALSTDGGASFPTTITTGLAGTAQTFLWTVPAINTTQARIRVTAADAANNQGSAVSDANFSIATGGGNESSFSITTSPTSQTVTSGGAATFAIASQATGGFNQPINLTVAVSPSSANVTPSLSATSITPGNSAMLTVNTLASTPSSTFTVTITGTSGQIVRTTTATLNVVAPDYALSFSPAQASVRRKQKGQFIVNIGRTGGFAGNVTVTAPDTKQIKIKITQPSLSTTGASVSFDFKVKKTAPVGTQQLTFTGRDDSGRVRTATLTLTIQQ